MVPIRTLLKNSKFLKLVSTLFVLVLTTFLFSKPVLAQISFYRPPSEDEVLDDPGYPGGESANGCLYTREDQQGLIYFCGEIKSSVTGKPLQGITVAVYEELPKFASFLDVSSFFSPTGKLKGDLVHLFSSTATNEDGHYEISGREGKSVYVAYLCGEDQIGGVKRIESLTRAETLLDFVECENNSYTTPPKKLTYVDRDGFTECTTNFLASYVDATTGGIDLVPNVGSLEKPEMEAPSMVRISNFDWRFVSYSNVVRSFNIVGNLGGTLETMLEGTLDSNAFTAPFGDTAWNEMGALRRLDCEIAYSPSWPAPGADLDGDGAADNINLCNIEEVNYYLEQSQNYAPSDDLYLVMNRLRFIPPWSTKLAFARVDFRSNIKQKNESNSATLRDLGIWSNYVGQAAKIKHPGSTKEGVDEDFSEDTLISCDDLVQKYYMFEDKSASFASSFASPGEIQRDVIEAGGLVIEDEYPVCNDVSGNYGGGLITRKQACIDIIDSPLCTPSAMIPALSGANLDATTSEPNNDSQQYGGNNVRGEPYIPFFSEQGIKGPDFGRTQTYSNDPASTINVANGNGVTTSFLSGNTDLGAKQNYFGVFESPVDTIEPDSEDTPDTSTAGASSDYVASSNALVKEFTMQDLGSDSVSRCSISSIFEEETGAVGTFESITRQAIKNNTTVAEVLFTRLSNNFQGNKDHITDFTVGSGVLYTADSLRRDELLAESSGLGLQNIKRDIFDGLRSMASGYQVVDFGRLTASNILSVAANTFAAFGDTPTKSFSDRRHKFEANRLQLYVSYPLNQENFFSYFKKPVAPWRKGNWGEAPSESMYPWTSVPAGQYCNTFIDYRVENGKLETYDEDPNNPAVTKFSTSDFDLRSNLETYDKIKGISTTCRVGNCNYRVVEADCMGDGDLEDINVIAVVPGFCEEEDAYQCAINRKSTRMSDEVEDALGKKCEKAADTANLDDDEVVRTYETEIKICSMDRAGSYNYIPGVTYGIDNRIVGQDLREDSIITTDNFKNATENLSTAFSPVIGGQKIVSLAAYENDLTHSLQEILPGTVIGEDEDAAGRGYVQSNKNSGINPGVYTPAASVNSDGTIKPDNTQFIHCNEIGVSLDNAVILGCNPTDEETCYSCPIEEPFACKGELFQEIPNLDTIPVGYGTDKIRSLLEAHISSMDAGMWELYSKVEEEYQVPCEIIAGIHYAEGGNSPAKSMFDGSASLRNGDIYEDIKQATAFLINPQGSDGFLTKSWVGASSHLTATAQQWIGAMAEWNGGGANNQCDELIPGKPNRKNPVTGVALSDWPNCNNEDINSYYGFSSAYALNEIDDEHTGMSFIVPVSSEDGAVYGDDVCKLCAAGNADILQEYGALCNICTDPFTPLPWSSAGSFTFARYLNELIAGQVDGSCKPGDPVGTELPTSAFSGTGGACSLSGGQYLGGVPSNLQKLIESAAREYNVPASLILGVMYGEGSLNSSWDVNNVNNWSYECAEIETCDVGNPAGQGPFSFLEYYWDADIDIKYASRKIPGQEDRKTSRCNLLDQTYGIAAALSKGSKGTTAYPEPKSCFGVDYTDGTRADKFSTTCSWSDEQVNTAIRQNAGKCLSNSASGAGGSVTGNCNDDSCEQYNDCFTPGGRPTGNCQSHSSNVWKVYLDHK